MRLNNLLLLLLFAFLFSCKKNKNVVTTNTESGTVYQANISDAKTLVIISGTPSNTTGGWKPTHTLFKVTNEGDLQEVLYNNSDGTGAHPLIDPTQIYNLDATYLLVLNSGYLSNTSPVYLMRKSDGVFLPLKATALPETNTGAALINPYIQTWHIYKDANNNIFYPAYDAVFKIFKGTLSNLPNLNETLYSPAEESINSYEFDSRGNMLFISYFNSNPYFRLKKANGVIENIPNSGNGYFLGPDDNFYYLEAPTSYLVGSQYAVKKITIDASFNTSITTYGTYTFGYNELGGSFPYAPYKINHGGKSLFIGTSLSEFDPAGNSINNYVIPTKFQNTTDVCASDNFIYIAGKDTNSASSIFRISLSNYTTQSALLPLNKYDVYRVSSTKNDVTVFSALRFSDSKSVLVRLDENGNEKTLKESIDQKTIIVNIE